MIMPPIEPKDFDTIEKDTCFLFEHIKDENKIVSFYEDYDQRNENDNCL